MDPSSPRSTAAVLLLAGGIACLLIALLHVIMIPIGADAYRFFGAGEEMAVHAEAGSWIPGVVTGVLAIVFAIWGCYGLSGAGILRPLPFCRTALLLIGCIFLLRGIAFLPLLFLVESPHALELRARPLFSLASSVISLAIGWAYLYGSRRVPTC